MKNKFQRVGWRQKLFCNSSCRKRTASRQNQSVDPQFNHFDLLEPLDYGLYVDPNSLADLVDLSGIATWVAIFFIDGVKLVFTIKLVY
jgi:hypothetical protein